jgi:hypothetical protein
MTVTRTKLQEPATVGEFSLGVDDVFRPGRVSAHREVTQGTKEEVATTRCMESDQLVEWLVDDVGFPAGESRALAVQLALRLHAATLGD